MKTATLKDRKYAQRARRRFCGNSRTTPAELVLSGQRSLEEWVQVLNRGTRTPLEVAARR